MPDDDVDARFARLEHEMAELREQVTLAKSDAAAARVLAGGADRDVSEVRAELRAHTQSLNALRETQLEQGRAIDGLCQDVDGIRQDVDGLRQEVRSGFATMATGMAQITALLTDRQEDPRSAMTSGCSRSGMPSTIQKLSESSLSRRTARTRYPCRPMSFGCRR